MMHLSGHRLTPLTYSRREPTPAPTWVTDDTRQQGSFSEEEVEEQRERGQERRSDLQVLRPYESGEQEPGAGGCSAKSQDSWRSPSSRGGTRGARRPHRRVRVRKPRLGL